MSEALTLSAETRERAGKGASRAMRLEGRVPAVIYGNKQEALSIHVEEKVLVKMLNTGHFMNSVVMIEGAGAAIRTLPKDVQFHPVTDRPLHVDFLRIGEHTSVHVNVPVVFTDEEKAPGIKRGGVLNVVRHAVECMVDPDNVPPHFDADLSALDINDAVRWHSLTGTEGIRPIISGRDFVIATIAPPTKSAEPTAEATAAAAPAVAPAAATAAKAPAAAKAPPAKK